MSENKKNQSRRLDPDVRFLLANERTLLAWIRTSLAVMAGGVALAQFGKNSATHSVIGVIAIMIGAFMAVVGYVRFKAADRAIREDRLPPTGSEPIILVGGLIIVALALVITRIMGLW